MISKNPGLVSTPDSKGGQYPIYYAISYDNPDMVRLLVENGASTDLVITTLPEISAIEWSAKLGTHDATAYLLTQVKQPHPDQLSQVIRSTSRKDSVAKIARQIQIVTWMLDNGWELEGRDYLGRTPLLSAASAGNPQTLELLVARGANIHARDNQDQGALMLALSFRHVMVDYLLGLGLDINGYHGSNAPEWWVEWLKEERITPLHKVVQSDMSVDWSRTAYMRLFRKLLELGASPAALSEGNALSLLHFAAMAGNPDFVRALLEQGANPSYVDAAGYSALDYAAISYRKTDNDPLFGSYRQSLLEVQKQLVSYGGRYAKVTPIAQPRVEQEDRSVLAVMGGLAAAVAGQKMGMSEQSAINLGVNTAQDVQDGGVSQNTLSALNTPQSANQPFLQTYQQNPRQQQSPTSKVPVATTVPKAISPQAPVFPEQSVTLIQPHFVEPETIRNLFFKGEMATVSSELPERVYGVYQTPSYNGNAQVSSIARRFILNADGTGSFQGPGRDGPIKPFNWGVLVKNGQLEVSSLTTPMCFEDNSCFDTAPSYIIVFEYLHGDFGYSYLFEAGGRLAMPGSYNMAVEKQ